MSGGRADPEETTYEVTPIKVGDTLYLCTPHQTAIALDPETGEERWRFDPQVGTNRQRQHQTCQGVSDYEVEGATPEANCARRILLPTSDGRLIALDAATGEICAGFGDQGTVDLSANMPFHAGSYYSTSPPVVACGLIVVGGAVNDNVSTTEPSGVIRAYRADTGELVWNFDTGDPTQTEPIGADETYMPNSPNAWSILSVDPPDQWGGERTPQTERFSSSVIALDLEIGQLRWTFQTVHHDLWDMDVPSQPQLEDVQREGETVPAVVQATKQGDIYVRDRRTGEPLLPVTEEQAPTGAAEGGFAAPTQPTSALSFKPDMLRERDMWGVTMFDQLYCRIQFRSMNYEGRYTPPSVRAPSSIPAISASSTGVARRSIPFGRIVLANPVYLAFTVKLIPRADDKTNYVSEGEPGFNENDGAPSAAADLETGKIIWRHKNGTVRDLAPVPLPFKLGVPALGGPRGHRGRPDVPQRNARLLVRAFDSETGEELWRDRRPAGAQATPMTYRGEDGRQYLVVVADGHGSTGTKAGDHVIAYALPPG